MNTNARNKLRSMGGIMASSPELMQAAQGFQAGGRVDVASAVAASPEVRVMAQRMGMSVPEYLASLPPAARQQLIRNTMGGSNFDAASDTVAYQDFANRYEAETSLPSQAELDLGPRQESYRNRDRALGISTLPSRITAPSAGEAPAVPSAGGPTLAAASRQSPSTRPSMPVAPPPSTELDASDIPYNTGAAIARKRAELEAETDPDVRRGLENQLALMESVGQAEDIIVEDVIAPAAEAAVDPVTDAAALAARSFNNPLTGAPALGTVASLFNPRAGGSILNAGDQISEFGDRLALAGQEDVDPIEQLVNDSLARTGDALEVKGETEAEAEQPPAPEADAEEKAPPRPLDDLQIPEELFERVQKSLEDDPRLGGGGGDGGGDGDGDGDGDGPPPPPPEPTKKDLRSRYKEWSNILGDIYGESDKDRVQDRMLSLALTGLAIASGASPNFLTNVAQGAAVGLQSLSESERARREQEQGRKTLALETAISEMDAEREAAARAAESRLDFERDVILKGMESDGGSKFRNARNVAEQALLEENKIREFIETNGVPEQYKNNPQAYITNERNKSMLEYVDTLGIQGTIEDPRQRASLGQQYMYKDVDPEDPSAGRFPVVRSPRELSFILPGQSYLELDPKTGKYTRQTKPADE